MSPCSAEQVRRAIGDGLALLGVPAHLIDLHSHLPALLRGVAAACPEAVPDDLQIGAVGSSALSRRDWLGQPTFEIAPIEHLIAYLALWTRADLDGFPSTGQKAALVDPAHRRQRNRELVIDVIAQTVKIAEHRRAMRDHVVRPGVLDRYRRVRWLLDANPASILGDTRIDRLQEAKSDVESRYCILTKSGRYLRSKYPPNWLSIEVGTHRAPDLFARLAGMRGDSPAFRCDIEWIDRARKLWELDSEALAPEVAEPSVMGGPTLEPQARRAEAHAHQAKFLPHRCACGGEIGRVGFLRVVEAAQEDRSDEAGAILAIAGALLSHRSIVEAGIDPNEGAIRIPMTRPHEVPPQPELYLPATSCLNVRLDPSLVMRVHGALSACEELPLKERLDLWLDRAVPGATMAQLEHFLLWRGPMIHRYPFPLAWAGGHGWKTKSPAPCSYTLITPAMIDMARPYAEWVLGPGQVPWVIDADHPGVGSARVPRTEVIRAIASRSKELVVEPGGMTPDQAYARSATLAACCDFWTMYLSGVRNAPRSAVPGRFLDRPWAVELIRQKGAIMQLVATPVLLAIVRPLAAAWRAAANAAAKADGAEPPPDHAYAYPDLEDGRLVWRDPEPWRMAYGFAADPKLKHAARLVPNAHRHAANTILRASAAISELEIRELHGHHPTRFSNHAAHRFELPVHRERLDAITRYLAQEAGLL